MIKTDLLESIKEAHREYGKWLLTPAQKATRYIVNRQ
jgi:hypothetical protein